MEVKNGGEGGGDHSTPPPIGIVRKHLYIM